MSAGSSRIYIYIHLYLTFFIGVKPLQLNTHAEIESRYESYK